MSERFETGGGEGRPQDASEEPTLVAHEETVRVDKRWQGVGHLRARRVVERETVREQHPRQLEQLAHERVATAENDSGRIETLPDGSISIPLFEEVLEVTRRTVLRERILIRKELATEWQTVQEELRREQISFDTEGLPAGAVEGVDAAFAHDGGTRNGRPIETRPFFLTSEFIALALTLVAALVVLLSDLVSTRLFMTVAVVLVAAYAISRGFAKAGTESNATDPRDNLLLRAQRR